MLFSGFVVTVLLGYFLGESQACVCTKNYEPLCGSNGVTYSNACMLKCANAKGKVVFPVYSGRCEDGLKAKPRVPSEMPKPVERSACGCPFDTNLVCDTDNKTWMNKCHLDCGEATLAYEGRCEGDPGLPEGAAYKK